MRCTEEEVTTLKAYSVEVFVAGSRSVFASAAPPSRFKVPRLACAAGLYSEGMWEVLGGDDGLRGVVVVVFWTID